MYYSSGNYEAFARPRKPEGVDRKSAYIIGSGLAAGLRALGLRVIDGKANYLLFRAPADLNERLRPLGTQARSCANYPGLGPEWYRTAVRTAPENARLLELMKEVLG